MLKIGVFEECFVVQIQNIPRKLNDKKLKPSLNISQDVFVSDSVRIAGIFFIELPTNPFQSYT